MSWLLTWAGAYRVATPSNPALQDRLKALETYEFDFTITHFVRFSKNLHELARSGILYPYNSQIILFCGIRSS